MTWSTLGLGVVALLVVANLLALAPALFGRSSQDGLSGRLMVGAWLMELAVCLLEARFAPALWAEPAFSGGTGLLLAVVGVGLRVGAVRSLGPQFHPLVRLRPDHRLITTGLYARMRHPAYLGSLAWGLAAPLITGSALGFVALALAVAPTLAYRIRVEESLLEAAFGPAWIAYRQRVPALFPGWSPAAMAPGESG